jgi:ABC-type polar amino acid transport system ATPase subunit
MALAAVPQKFECHPIAAIQDNVATPVAVVAQHGSHKAKPIRILTNVNLEEREQLPDLGFSVQMSGGCYALVCIGIKLNPRQSALAAGE